MLVARLLLADLHQAIALFDAAAEDKEKLKRSDLQLEELFRPYGEVTSARVITDRDSGRSRGFGFVELEASDVAAVINALNGREIDGRPIRVNEAC